MTASLGLGCWAFGGVGPRELDDGSSVRIMLRAADLGVVHLDTAQDYGMGRSERVIARALAERPGIFQVATKCHLLESRAETIRAVELSLARLGVDSIDVFYIHWPRRGVDPAPMMEGLEACRARGLIRGVGVSNFSVADMKAAFRAGSIDWHELCWNLLWRRPELEIAPYCRSMGIRLSVYSPLAQGLLSGRGSGRGRFGGGDPRAATLYYREDVWPRLEPVLGAMRDLAEADGLALSELALRWALFHADADIVLAGASSVGQLESNAAAFVAGPLPGGLLSRIEVLSQEADSVIPPDEDNIFLYHP